MRSKLLILLGVLLTTGCITNKAHKEEAFSFAVIADVQYADVEERGRRKYRGTLDKLKECVEDLNQRDLAFTIQLGDLINGRKSIKKTLSDLDRVLSVYNTLNMPAYHVVGNHCLAAQAENLKRKLKLKRFYYDFTVSRAPGWRFVVLDGNDAGWGIIGDDQLKWLKATLGKAETRKETVILFNHYALLKEAGGHRMKKPEPVLELINQSDCVVAYFAGHDHRGGYALQKGIHHITLKAMVEAPPSTAYAVIHVSPTGLEEVGFGKEPSRSMPIGQTAAEGVNRP
jgi:3',5'-cyclic AMP phosphodiesterase CpdA